MERVLHQQSSRKGLFRLKIELAKNRLAKIRTAGFRTGIAGALLLMAIGMPELASATVYIGGTPPATVIAHSNYNFTPVVSASAGAKVTFYITSPPYWATFNTSTGKLSGAVYAEEVGVYRNIYIHATDGTNDSKIGPFSITVEATSGTTPPTTGSGTTTTTSATLQLSSPTYSVSQTAGTLTVSVNRTAGSTGAVSTKYATANSSAVAGTDYTAVSGTLSWASGETSAKSFSVPVSNSKPFTGTKAFNVALSTPSTGA